MNIKKFQNETLDEGRNICNKNHLYVPTWSFTLWLHKDYENDLNSIYILYDGEKPIGSCLVLNENCGVSVGVFIKPQYRNRGFGSKLLRFVTKDNKDRVLQYDMGIQGSLEFFEKVKKKVDNLQQWQYGPELP